MNVADVVAHILKAEGVEYLFAYPVNPLIEAAAKVDIRPILVRQERIGLHMADALSRMTSGRQIGVFCMQSGPGSENAFGGVAQAYGDSAPILVLPMGYSRKLTNVQPNFNSALNYRHVTKLSEQVILPETVPEVMRRAFTQVRNGRPRPVLVEFPTDVFDEEVPGPFDYRPVPALRTGPDPEAVTVAATMLLDAQRPVIYAGQGVHYAGAWEALRELAELLEAPVTTSLGGKSAFPENHPLSLGSGGRSIPGTVHRFLQESDLIFGIGCSFSRTHFGVSIPEGKTVVHATLDAGDINKDVEVEHALLGDAKLILEAVTAEIRERLGGRPRGRAGTGGEGDCRGQKRVARAMDAETDAKRGAAIALSGDPGSDEDSRRAQYDHHPRCRQPKRSAFSVLGISDAAFLHRLGKDDPTRLRAGSGNGRQARQTGQALYKRMGRCRYRIYRYGF